MVKQKVEYDASIWAERDAEREKRFKVKLKRQAHQRAYKVVPIEEKTAAYIAEITRSGKEFLKSGVPAWRDQVKRNLA
jgi:hypothetical protein